MPVSLDEYPIHQTPLSMRYVDSSDRNFYDRCYFNAHDRSGEIFLAASTTSRTDRDGTSAAGPPKVAGGSLDPLFEAVVDAAEESVLSSLLHSPTTVGRDGNTSEGLDGAVLARLLEENGHRGL